MKAHKIGYHWGNEAPLTEVDWEIQHILPPAAVKFLPNYGWHSQPIGLDDIRRVLDISPTCHIIPRPYLAPSRFGNWDSPNYDFLPDWADQIKRLMDDLSPIVPPGQRHMQLFNEPNMPRWSQWEGFGTRYGDMLNLNHHFLQTFRLLKAHDPSWQIGFPPLTIGNYDLFFKDDHENVAYYTHGPEAAKLDVDGQDLLRAKLSGPCYSALRACDEFYTHSYIWNDMNGSGVPVEEAVFLPWAGQRYAQAALFLPSPKRIFITEAGVTTNGRDIHIPALLDWLSIIHHDPNVVALTLWILGSHYGHLWADPNDRSKPHPAVYAMRDFVETLPSLPVNDATFRRYLGDLMQQHVIPVNLEAAFYKRALRDGGGRWERISKEVDFPSLSVRAQVFYKGPASNEQRIYYAFVDANGNPLTEVGVPTSWEHAIRFIDRPN